MAITVNCCWNSAQNITEARNIGMNEITRRRSSACVLELPMRIANRTTAPTAAIAVTMLASHSSGTRPVAMAATMRTTTTTPTPR